MAQFKQMTIGDTFKEYIEKETPKFDGRWVTEQFYYHDQDQLALNIIYDSLTNQGKNN